MFIDYILQSKMIVILNSNQINNIVRQRTWFARQPRRRINRFGTQIARGKSQVVQDICHPIQITVHIEKSDEFGMIVGSDIEN